jgi:hypothetical protein
MKQYRRIGALIDEVIPGRTYGIEIPEIVTIILNDIEDAKLNIISMKWVGFYKITIRDIHGVSHNILIFDESLLIPGIGTVQFSEYDTQIKNLRKTCDVLF